MSGKGLRLGLIGFRGFSKPKTLNLKPYTLNPLETSSKIRRFFFVEIDQNFAPVSEHSEIVDRLSSKIAFLLKTFSKFRRVFLSKSTKIALPCGAFGKF